MPRRRIWCQEKDPGSPTKPKKVKVFRKVVYISNIFGQVKLWHPGYVRC